MTVLLLIAAVVVGYLAVMSILTPERFSKTRIAREAPIQVRLKEVAHVENAFHDVYNRYAHGMTPEEFLQVPGFPESIIEIDTASVAQEIGEDVVMVPVFRTAVPLSVYLADQDHKLLNTAIKDAEARYQGTGYPGLALGSLKEVKNTGNWE